MARGIFLEICPKIRPKTWVLKNPPKIWDKKVAKINEGSGGMRPDLWSSCLLNYFVVFVIFLGPYLEEVSSLNEQAANC